MDISTGHMVLAYMEDHLKNKQRLEQEWVALCGYEAEPCATTIAFKVNSVVRHRNSMKNGLTLFNVLYTFSNAILDRKQEKESLPRQTTIRSQ